MYTLRRHMRFPSALLTAFAAIVLIAHNAFAAQFSTLHSFTDPVLGHPDSPLTPFGPDIFGTTLGSQAGFGSVFAIRSDGTGFRTLHSFDFSNFSSNGGTPIGGLVIGGSTIYGTTIHGGAGNRGTVFALNTDGSDYRVLHDFLGTNFGDGNTPGRLTLAGSTLYGTSGTGGPDSGGTIFRLNTDGTGYQLLHAFNSFDGSPKLPNSALTIVGSRLYGTTYGETTGSSSSLFSLNLDGSDFRILHTFDANTVPLSLVAIGSTLFGATELGGASNVGTLFSIDSDGTNLRILHSFSGSPTDGSFPGSLTVIGTSLFGVTRLGGTNGSGTLFSVDSDGSNFQTLYSFTGMPNESRAELAPLGSSLVGITQFNGTDDLGTLFTYGLVLVPEPSGSILGLIAVALVALKRTKNRAAAWFNSLRLRRPPTLAR